MTAKERRVLGLLLLIVLVLLGWDRCTLSGGEKAAVDAWLVCEDCMDGELDSVLALAAAKPRATRVWLRSALLEGPSPARVAHVKAQAKAAYLSLGDYLASHGGQPLPMTQADYVELFRQNYVDSQRKRAAIALRKVGGPFAMAALDRAAAGAFPPGADTLRPDVLAVVIFARDTMNP